MVKITLIQKEPYESDEITNTVTVTTYDAEEAAEIIKMIGEDVQEISIALKPKDGDGE